MAENTGRMIDAYMRKQDMTEQSANDRQVAGDHYCKREYQHWDFVTDIGLPYLPAQATRYAARWRDKNGAEDLQKCIHYIDKTKERKVDWPWFENYDEHLSDFVRQFDPADADLIMLISTHRLRKARALAETLLASAGAPRLL